MRDQDRTDGDDLLDRMLTVYGEVNPPDGLETRVLGTIERTLNRRRHRTWFLLAGPAVAAVATFVFLFGGRGDNPERKPTREVSRADPAVVPAASPSQSAQVLIKRPHRVMPVNAAAPRSPRQATFPAASKLSEQERVLLSLMGSNEQALVALAQLYRSETANADSLGSKERIP
jgi:hypothetical protein